MTDFNQILFDSPVQLGAKHEDVDYLVRLWNAQGVFFVQVKTTEAPLTSASIQVRLTNERRIRLMELPGPTYVAGVHAPSKRCFLRSIDKSLTTGITSIPLANELHAVNRQRLYDEVKAFWATIDCKPVRSVFA